MCEQLYSFESGIASKPHPRPGLKKINESARQNIANSMSSGTNPGFWVREAQTFLSFALGTLTPTMTSAQVLGISR